MLLRYTLAVCTKQALWKYLGIGLQRRHSGAGGTIAGAQVCQSCAQEYDPGSGQVGGGSRTESVCRSVSEVCGARPDGEAGAAQYSAESGGDVMGPVEKWQRLSPRMGGSGGSRVDGNRGVSVGGRCGHA